MYTNFQFKFEKKFLKYEGISKDSSDFISKKLQLKIEYSPCMATKN